MPEKSAILHRIPADDPYDMRMSTNADPNDPRTLPHASRSMWASGRRSIDRGSPRYMLAAVWTQEIENRPDRHNSRWIDRRVALIIVVLDMSKIRCSGDTRMLIKLAGEAPEIGVIHD